MSASFLQIDEQSGENAKLKPFTFNVVFEPEATQEDIVEHSGIKRLVDMAVDGFSTTVFCYGQTGSGKTHTLTGPPHLVRLINNMFLIQRVKGAIFFTEGHDYFNRKRGNLTDLLSFRFVRN